MGARRQSPRPKRLANKQIIWFYRKEPDGRESAFGIEVKKMPQDVMNFALEFQEALEYLPEHEVTTAPMFDADNVVIIGPRLDFPDTPFSSAAVEIASQTGFPDITRVEQFHCYAIPQDTTREEFANSLKFDNRVETLYDRLPATYRVYRRAPKVKEIDILRKGRRELTRFNKRHSLGLLKEQLDRLYVIFTTYGRNPTDLTLFNISQMWSNHCWHFLFMLTDFIIDGQKIEGRLIDFIKAPYKALEGTAADNAEINMHDNASAVAGARVKQLIPEHPGKPSLLVVMRILLHLLFSNETHNYPSQIASYQGRATEIGGEIRDQLGAGRGSDITHAGCLTIVGSLRFKNGYKIPGEIVRGRDYSLPEDKKSPTEILVEGTQGWVDYANAFGKALTLFEVYSGAVWRPRLRDGKVVLERMESLKPVCDGFGIGNIRDDLKKKRKPKKGWVIVRMGGGARDVGFCGGSGSSSVTGTYTVTFDQKAVQRGNAIEERAFYEVIRTCNQMGQRSPIEIIHDQGAGGLGNMMSELIGVAGGRIYLGSVTCDDPSMGDVKIYVAEWQESQGVLVRRERLNEFLAICIRESCTADVIGEITGDGVLKVFHGEYGQGESDQALFEMLMKDLLEKSDELKLEIEDESPEIVRLPVAFRDTGMSNQLKRVLHRSEVASTEWFLRLVDGSIGGHVVKGPYCGPHTTPIPNYSVVALSNSFDDLVGQASAMGTAPYATCLDPKVGIRLALGRLLTRMMLAGVSSIDAIKLLLNWMWPATLTPPDGEIAMLLQATQAVKDALIELGTAIIGGKDSPSMATWVKGVLVKSIETVVFSSSALVEDYNKHLTADIKTPGHSVLVHIDFARGKRRLGGSSFAASHDGQLGDWAPDMDDAQLFRDAFPVVHELIDRGLATAGIEIGQGGLAAAISQMCIAGGCGAFIRTDGEHSYAEHFFAGELGLLVESGRGHNVSELTAVLNEAEIPYRILGLTSEEPKVVIEYNGQVILEEKTADLRHEWEQTSHEIRRLLVNEQQADLEWERTRTRRTPPCVVTCTPFILKDLIRRRKKPLAVAVRYRGTNGIELEDAFAYAGWDVKVAHFNDILAGRLDFDDVDCYLGEGGWADKDVYGSAMGMMLRIKRNPIVREVYRRFLAREDTTGVGICNQSQLFTRLGIAPFPELAESRQRPLFTQIDLGRFNHQWVTVKVEESPCIATRYMVGSIIPVVVANGEGKFNCSAELEQRAYNENLVVLSYVDDDGQPTDLLPWSPSGSRVGAVTDPTGRFIASMPHIPERSNRASRMPYLARPMRQFAQDCGGDVTPCATIPVSLRDWHLAHR